MNDLSRQLILMALDEDLADLGDITSRYFVDPTHRSIGSIVSRETAVISGCEVAAAVCAAVSEELRFRPVLADGDRARPGDLVAEITGPTRLVLTAERTVLNFLQRLSGIATITRDFVEAVHGTSAQLLDTRKTTPGWRELEKAAVLHGGGRNHRMGLYDAVMVKDNHLVANPSPLDLGARIAEIKTRTPGMKIEIEADRLDQVASFLPLASLDVILLDNMSNDELRRAVALRDQLAPAVLLEASGGVHLTTVRGIAETGVDFISVGALTHSVRSVDLGLDLIAA
ncbi:MAG: carboxylating nicotinate-nucleotide diphosphorylase [Verrucomicrobiaceae bacterium]|nr:carboxylating nicotinate-nucleotide diphosphorylase [Verrucomicrobiaceae bacterium]